MSAVVPTNVTGAVDLDDEAVASLLRDVQMIAAKEVEVDHDSNSMGREGNALTRYSASSAPMLRGRSISFASEELTCNLSSSPSTPTRPLSPPSISTLKQPKVVPPNMLEHHDWSNHVGPRNQKPQVIVKKKGKRQDESFVGQIPKAKIRATLRRKFSWKQYPELEEYLLKNHRAYFEFSSRNYTPQQRNFNNTLTRELLELASNHGYAFEGFTFAMVRDRIRCYFKSYVQSAKKRGIIVGYASKVDPSSREGLEGSAEMRQSSSDSWETSVINS